MTGSIVGGFFKGWVSGCGAGGSFCSVSSLDPGSGGFIVSGGGLALILTCIGFALRSMMGMNDDSN